MKLKVSLLVATLFLFCGVVSAQDEYETDTSQRIHFSGEAGAGFFDTGKFGMFPNSEFRLDEAKLFVEAQIVNDVYVFGELNLMTREDGDENVSIGEVYLEVENISKLWNQENMLNARAGRMDIPFGEEYQMRDVIDNPLVTHSLSDIWGVDEGVELYGKIQKFEYTFAVQNGSDPSGRDYNSDKAIVGRFLFRPASKAHFSFSAMRTGKIDADRDQYSAVWFGNSLLHLLGPDYSSPTFRADAYEGDGHFQWNSGSAHGAVGHFQYEDQNAPNERSMRYYYIEGTQNLMQKQSNVWYAAARYSRIDADPEFPIIGNGDYLDYFNYAYGTKFLWRLGLGSGYRIGRHFLFKVEYAFERGEQADGSKRNNEDFFSIVAAARF